MEYPFGKQKVAQKLSFMIQNTFGPEEGMPKYSLPRDGNLQSAYNHQNFFYYAQIFKVFLADLKYLEPLCMCMAGGQGLLTKAKQISISPI